MRAGVSVQSPPNTTIFTGAFWLSLYVNDHTNRLARSMRFSK